MCVFCMCVNTYLHYRYKYCKSCEAEERIEIQLKFNSNLSIIVYFSSYS